MAGMAAVRGDEFVVDSGWDVWLWDADRRRCLDAATGLCGANIGHGRHEIAQAISVQLWRVETAHHPTEPALELARRLAERAPMPAARVLLTSSGETAGVAAGALARRYWSESGESERRHVVTARHLGHDSLEAAAHAIEALGAGSVAAFVVDPVLGAAGVHTPLAGYLEDLAALLRDAGVLLIADAVIAGFGRLGTWFGIERWPVEPDMIVFGESVTGGYLPLGGVLVGARVAAAGWRDDGAAGGHAACCAAALKTIEIMEDEGLVYRGRELEDELDEAIAPLRAHPLVAGVRSGVGTLAAVELDPVVAPSDVHRLARDRGVLVRPLATSIAVAPPLTATPAHFRLIAGALAEALGEL
jgi:putrescine---pyruvate transaminase